MGYKVAKRLCDALLSSGWITHHAEAKINLFDGDSNCNGYLVADHVPQLSDGLKFQSTDLGYASSSSATKKKLEVDHVDDRVRSLWAVNKCSYSTNYRVHPQLIQSATLQHIFQRRSKTNQREEIR